MESVVVLDPMCWGHLVRRRGLVFDSRFLPHGGEPRGCVVLYALTSGWLELHGGPRYDAPAVWVLRDEEFDCLGPESRTFRSGGEPATAFCLFLRELPPSVSVGLEEPPRTLPTPVVEAVDALFDDERTSARLFAFREILRGLSELGVLGRDVVDGLVMDEPEPLMRVWQALAALYEQQDTLPQFDVLADLVGLSRRQVQRDVAELAARMGMHGFRSTARDIRLRRAALLLSAPSLTVADVAKTVGYGSADAMGRAFRDGGLLSPSRVRAALEGVAATPDP